MKLFYFPDYNGYIHRDSSIAFGERILNTKGLLDLLELHAGKKREEKTYMERVVDYTLAMKAYLEDTPDSIFASSYAIDSLNTAERILSWRDTLVSFSWSGADDAPSQLLREIGGIEGYFSAPSEWERLQTLTEEVKGGCHLPRSLEMVLPFSDESFHPLVKDLLGALRERGVLVSVLEKADQREGSDLQKVTAFLLENRSVSSFSGDGSLSLLQFPSETEAYRYLTAKGENHELWIDSSASILDNWLQMEGKPTVGSSVRGITPYSQLLVLGLRLFSYPLNIEHLLSWLQSPATPVPAFFGKILSDTIVRTGGYYNYPVKKVIESFLHPEEEKLFVGEENREEKISALKEDRQRIVAHFLPPAVPMTSSTLEKETLLSFLQSLLSYVEERTHYVEAFSSVYGDTKALLRYLRSDERTALPFVELEAVMTMLNRSISLTQYEAETGAMKVVTSPSSLAGPVSSVLWRSFNDYTDSSLSTSFLKPMEKEYILSTSRPWREEDERTYHRLSLLLPFLQTREKLSLVVIDRGEKLEEARNPILLRLLNQLGLETVEKILSCPAIDKEAMVLPEKVDNYLGQGQEFITFSRPDLVQWPDHESYSSLDNMVFHPLDYVLHYLVGLEGSGIAAIADDKTTSGTVAHRVIEKIFGYQKDVPKSGTVSYIRLILENQVDDIITEALNEKGAILLREDNSSGLSVFRMQMKECLWKLLDLMEQNDLHVVETEVSINGTGLGFDPEIALHGSIDMVLEDNAGKLYIFDFKWSSSSYYRTTLEENLSIQLELYTHALARKTGKPVAAAAYVQLPEVKVSSISALKGAGRPIKVKENRVGSLLDEIRNSYRYRRSQIGKGRVEVGDGLPFTSITYMTEQKEKKLVPLKEDHNLRNTKGANGFSDYQFFKGVTE